MKRPLLIGFGIAIGLFLMLCGWFVCQSFSPFSPVTVTVKNKSQKVIALVQLKHEDGVEVIKNLARGDTRKIRFYPNGETAYGLRILFADSSEITGGGGYAENGYKLSETVTDTGIITEYEGLY